MPPRTPRFPRPLALPTFRLSGHMAKADTKPTKRPKRTDPERFERFIAAARKRGIDESLEHFAAKFFQERAAKAVDQAMSRAVRFCTEAFDGHGHDGMRHHAARQRVNRARAPRRTQVYVERRPQPSSAGGGLPPFNWPAA